MEIFTFSLLFIWQILQNIVALVMLPFLGKKHLVEDTRKWHCFVLEGEKMAGAISLGSFVILSNYSAKKKASVRHELGHVTDSHRFGPLYLFIIGIPSIVWASLHTYSRKIGQKCYYSFYTERRANANGGVKVVESNGRCYITI